MIASKKRRNLTVSATKYTSPFVVAMAKPILMIVMRDVIILRNLKTVHVLNKMQLKSSRQIYLLLNFK
jgi:hypothetical protein